MSFRPVLLGLAALAVAAPTSPAAEFTVVTYNVENLFDADGVAMFEDYRKTDQDPAYSPGHLLNKLRAVADTLKTFNAGAGPEIVAFNEFEIDFTPGSGVSDYQAFLARYRGTTAARMLTSELDEEVRGLPAEALLLKHLEDEGLTGYRVVVGADPPDFEALGLPERHPRKKAHRNALFSKFPVKDSRSHPTSEARDILEVTLEAGGHPFHVFVNHWKSGASSSEFEETRRDNARTLRRRVDQILEAHPAADILLTGDFNSQYNQSQIYPRMVPSAVNDILGSRGDEQATAAATNYSLYNLWHELPPEERRSDHYRGSWGTLMQTMVTSGLYDFRGVQYMDDSFEVVILDGFNAHTPLQIPKRWSHAAGGRGVSDHFPLAARFRVVPDNDQDRRQVLTNPGTEDGSARLLSIAYETLAPENIPAFSKAVAANPAGHVGEFYRVNGCISTEMPITVQAGGAEFRLFTHDYDFRREIEKFPRGSTVEFIGELRQHRGHWQFIIARPSWLLQRPQADRSVPAR